MTRISSGFGNSTKIFAETAPKYRKLKNTKFLTKFWVIFGSKKPKNALFWPKFAETQEYEKSDFWR